MMALREILDGYAEGQGQRARRGDLCAACEKAGVHHTDCHASGMLCRVTASTIIVVRPSLLLALSSSLPTCRWGIR